MEAAEGVDVENRRARVTRPPNCKYAHCIVFIACICIYFFYLLPRGHINVGHATEVTALDTAINRELHGT